MVDAKAEAQFRQMQRALQAQLVPRTVTAAATVALSDYLIACDATSAPFTLSLPAVKDAKGMSFLVVKTDSSANAVTIDGSGSETINGATTLVLSRQWNGVELYCNGVSWFTVIPSALLAASLGLTGDLAVAGITTTGGAANTGAAVGDIVLANQKALRTEIGGSARNLVSVDANNVVQLGESGNYVVALPRFTGVAASANYKGVIFADTGTAGQLVFYDGVTGARYKLTGTAF